MERGARIVCPPSSSGETKAIGRDGVTALAKVLGKYETRKVDGSGAGRQLMARRAAIIEEKDHTTETFPLVDKLASYLSLSPAEIEFLRDLHGLKRRFNRHRDIVAQGRPYRSVFILCSGFVCRYKILPEGTRQVLNLLLPGDLIGFPACFFENAVNAAGLAGGQAPIRCNLRHNRRERRQWDQVRHQTERQYSSDHATFHASAGQSHAAVLPRLSSQDWPGSGKQSRAIASGSPEAIVQQLCWRGFAHARPSPT